MKIRKKRFLVKRNSCITALAAFLLLTASASAQQTNAPAATAAAGGQSKIQNDIAAYLRHVYAFGPEVELVVAPLHEVGTSGIMETTIGLTVDGNHEDAAMYVTKDGKYLLRGELSDLTKDPLAEALQKLETKNAPVLGSPNAPVTLVEFSDFQCPVCKALHDALREMLPKYPQVKVVFKDFPLEAVHPWARTAALAGRCAYQADPKSFWKLYDLIYDNQDVTSPENVWAKMNDYASQIGLNPETFKACLASPRAAAEVDESLANGKLLEVGSTPTMFVNGRRLVGADPHRLQEYIEFEIAAGKSANPEQKK
jgi:protein-disulfide isomerase